MIGDKRLDSKILVTGATGFIGSKLVDDLINEGFDVTSLVRDRQKANPKSKIIEGDLTDPKMKIEGNFDTVFHLASHTPLERNKKTLKKVNLEGTKNLFEQIKSKTKSLVYISGMGVFGEPKNTVDESSPLKPNTDFVKIRLEAQNFLEEECKKNNIDFTVVYFGDVYGKTGWFNDMLIQRLGKKTFKIPGSGDYVKGFVHVDDAVGSMIAIQKKKAFNEKYIVVDSNPISFKDFVNYTAEKINAKKPGSVPMFLAKAVMGGDLIKLLTTPITASNEKIKKIYDFKFPDYKKGIDSIISS